MNSKKQSDKHWLQDFVLLSLATWRMASLLAREDGPFNRVFLQLRQAAGVVYEDEKTVNEETGEEEIDTTMTPTNWVAEGLICMKCNSVWVGTVLTILYFISPSLTRLLVLPLALSTMSIFQQEIKTFFTKSD